MAGQIEGAPSKVQNGAWWTLVCAIPCVFVTGTMYGVGEWSSVLKETYEMDQQRLEVLMSITHFGNYIVLDSGLLVSRYGTTLALLLGLAYAGVGYLGLWFGVQVFPGQFPYLLLAVFSYLYGHGCGSIDNAVFSQVLSDFPDNRGNVTGCLKAILGLAPATAGILYEALFEPEKSCFLLFLGCFSLLCLVTLVPVVHMTKGLVDEPPRRVWCKFTSLVTGIIVLALFIFFVQLRREEIEKRHSDWNIVLALTLVPYLGLPLLPLLREKGGKSREASSSPLAGAAVALPTRNISGCEMLREPDFYILMFILIISQGNGLMFISNAPQILAAYSGSREGTTPFVAVLSVFNALGRLLFGNSSEWFKGWVHRPWFLVACACLLLTANTSLTLAGTTMTAWATAAIVGFGYGGLWGVQPSLLSDLFGLKDYGFKYACSAIAAFFGSLIFNDVIAGPLYERAADELGQAPHCLRPVCFGMAFAVAATSDVVALLLSLWLSLRTRWVYEVDEDSSSEENSSSSDEGTDVIE